MRKVWYLFLALCVVGFAPVFAQEADEPVSMVDGKPDTDGDGMPDWWEIQYGLNPKNMFDGKMDMDGDKIKNIDEYKQKTNPTDKDIDKNKDGVADDWMKFYGLTDANADADGDGVSNKEEYESGTNPKDANSSPKKVVTVSQKHPEPSMAGVKENIDPSIPDNHQIKPNVFKYLDPIGDDKGPGYYTYPTNPVYSPGGFDLVSFEVDASDPDLVTFKVTVNADLKQDWGMAADFDIQFVQIYIDQDRVPGSGNVKSVPGLNVYFDPANAWDKVVLISPQPDSRVEIEVDVKAKDMSDNIIIPSKIMAQGRTLVAIVKKSVLGVTPDTDISQWGWQVILQSNEGYPDPEDVLTRNVNEYKGLHRFGGGNDYWGDPELIDILVWPGKGTLQEAKDQFAILNVWESYPDPKLDIKAIVPLLLNDATAQWAPSGGYSAFAKDLASKIKPPAQKDKYVSDNFTFSGSANAQWYFNLDSNARKQGTLVSGFGLGGLGVTFNPEAYYDNSINSRFTLEFYGKAFTDLCNFYARLETWWGSDSPWNVWTGNFNRDNQGPGYVPLLFDSLRFQLVKPIEFIDYISIGNYEFGYNAWTAGNASYPDRDKFKGIFMDMSFELWNTIASIGYFYPFPWLGLGWNLGDYTDKDMVLAGLLKTKPLKGLNITFSVMTYADNEKDLASSDGSKPYSVKPRLLNDAYQMSVSYDILSWLTVDVLGALSLAYTGPGYLAADPIPEFDKTGLGATKTGYATVVTIKALSIGGSAFSAKLQGFLIDKYYISVMAARGDYANAAAQDVLLMYGNQSASYYPQDAASYQKYGNPMWESVAAGGWMGGTGILEASFAFLSLHLEGSYWQLRGFNDSVVDFDTITTNVTGVGFSAVTTYETNFNYPYAIRLYGTANYKLDVGNGIEMKLAGLFNETKNWWPMTAHFCERGGISGPGAFTEGFIFDSITTMFTVAYQWSKLFRTHLGVDYRFDIITDLYDWDKNVYNVSSLTIKGGFVYSTPLGLLRTEVQYFTSQNPRHVQYGGVKDDWRIPVGYFTQTYGVVALTELDISF